MVLRSVAPRPVTIYDVARQAGVSHQTVSRVINGGRGVSPGTLARVRAVCSDLGFIANPSARDLRRGQNAVVGLVVDISDLSAHAWALVHDLGRRARCGGGHLVVESADGTDPMEMTQAVERLQALHVRNVLVLRGDRLLEASAAGASVRG